MPKLCTAYYEVLYHLLRKRRLSLTYQYKWYLVDIHIDRFSEAYRTTIHKEIYCLCI